MDERRTAANPVTTQDPFQENTEQRLVRAEAAVARVESRRQAQTGSSERLRRRQTAALAAGATILLLATVGTVMARRRRQRRTSAWLEAVERAASRFIAGRF